MFFINVYKNQMYNVINVCMILKGFKIAIGYIMEQYTL
jgi:hypothetical protein